MIKDLIDEYDDRPEESRIIGSTSNTQDIQNNDDIELKEILRYEEENFIRLNLSKKDLKKLKKNKRFEDEFEVFTKKNCSCKIISRVKFYNIKKIFFLLRI